MSFVLKQTATYKWPVKIVLAIDNGKREVSTFDAEFKRLKQSRINELLQQVRDQERGRSENDTLIQDTEIVKELLVGWDGVNDDSGAPIPFSEAALDQLVDIPTVAGQIIKTWFESLQEAKRKN
jgi:hypothetical protein